LTAREGDLDDLSTLGSVNLPRLLCHQTDWEAFVAGNLSLTGSVALVGASSKSAVRHGTIIGWQTTASHLKVEHVLVVGVRSREVRVAVMRLDLTKVIPFTIAIAFGVGGVWCTAMIGDGNGDLSVGKWAIGRIGEEQTSGQKKIENRYMTSQARSHSPSSSEGCIATLPGSAHSDFSVYVEAKSSYFRTRLT
jgi:hypothetical protein